MSFSPATAAIETPGAFNPETASEDIDVQNAPLTDQEVVSLVRKGVPVGIGNFLKVAGKRLVGGYEQDGQKKPSYLDQAVASAFLSRAPVPEIPMLEAKGGTAEQIARGFTNAASQVVNALPTAGTLSVITSPPAALLVGASMLKNAFTEAPEVGRAVVDPKVSTMDKTMAVTGTFLQGVGAVLGGKSATKYTEAFKHAAKADEAATAAVMKLSDGQRALEESQRRTAALAQQAKEVEALAANQTRATDFAKARSEEAGQQIKANQLAGDESAVFEKPTTAQEARLDVGGFKAGRERARLAEANRLPEVDDGTVPSSTKLSSQAQRMLDEYGAINTQTLAALGQTTTGAAGGFAWGYWKGKDLPETERVANALQWAVFGGLLASPLRAKAVDAISKVRIPTGKATSLFSGAEHFYLFPKTILKEVHEAMRGQSAETNGLALNALKAYDQLDSLAKNATAGDRVMVGNYLRGQGSSGNIFDPKLKAATEKVRASIDDFTIEMKAMGLIEQGSDMDAVTTANLGAYLTRAYRAFEEPGYKPDKQAVSSFVNEYVKDQLLNRSTTPVPELRQQGYETALRLVSKGQGGAMENARQFALGNGIARTDGSLYRPRKDLSDATRRLLGEIDDPIKAAGQSIDRMAHYIGASITQTKMREVGLNLGLFSERATDRHTVPLTVGSEQARGPLSGLWSLPEVSDALKSEAAYHQNGLAWRALATATAYSKLSKTAANVVSYAPNFWSSWLNVISQGASARTVFHPSKVTGDALRVTFDDVIPSESPKIQRDAEFLTRERLLRQNVNLTDMLDHMRQTFGAGAARNITAKLPKAVSTAAKKTGSGVLNAYGKFEEFPRILGFYAEVERYRKIFPNLPESEIYSRAADVTRRVFPNASETPDFIRKLSVTGIANPFIAWTYETLWRNPIETFRVAKADIQEGLATNNPRLIAAGANRAAWYTGTVFGALALNEALKTRNGVSDRQEDAIKRMVPNYDRDGLLLIHELTPQQLAYANQSYLVPHSLPAAAMKAALSGVSPEESLALFGKELLSNFYGDGGTVLGPAAHAFTGIDEFNRKITTQDAGAFLDVNGIRSPTTQTMALRAQQGLERFAYFLDKAYTPGTVNEVRKWKRAINEEVGPDGQLYNKGDLLNRLGGYRLTRLDVPKQFERQAKDFGARLRDIGSQHTRTRNRADTTPEDAARSYETQEHARRRVFGEIVTFLDDAVELGQPRENVVTNLRNAGVSSELILGALNGYYVPGSNGKDPSLQERFDALIAMPEATRKAQWATLMKDEPVIAKEMVARFKEAARSIHEEDKLLLGMGVTDGTRARNVARLISRQPTDEAKRAVYREFVQKGVINGIVAAQLRDPQLWAHADSQTKAP